MLAAERARAYLEILERGSLNVRTLLARGDVEQAMVETNQVASAGRVDAAGRVVVLWTSRRPLARKFAATDGVD